MTHDVGVATFELQLAEADGDDWLLQRARIEHLATACNAALVDAAPDWIGHLKILAQTERGAAAYLSITAAGQPISWHGTLPSPTGTLAVTVYAAVWGSSDAALAAALQAVRAAQPW